ncbi:helix-turn-helix transcriptional regulator [Myceligenerans crystallogenes]|uniref:Helix-turn-helix transcriptional regulator n=1 Tax=Myceligenerans crystallogenes TaxID=316335 RepID=A0ABN2N5D5_9MICO
MEARGDIKEFLTTRRARLTPQQAGLPDYGGHRRVPGLRREEVALLAGISVEYYNRLERGVATGVSPAVLDGLARALQLDDLETDHLRRLLQAADSPTPGRPSRPKRRRVHPALQQLLDAMTGVPAIVQNGRYELVATNALGAALYSEVLDQEQKPPSFPRYVFLDPRSQSFYQDWDESAELTVALLRTRAGQDPHDLALQAVIGELSTKSETFRRMWAEHRVREHRSGKKRLHHSVVGDIELAYEGMELQTDRDLILTTYTAEPGSASADALTLLSTMCAEFDPLGADLTTET